MSYAQIKNYFKKINSITMSSNSKLILAFLYFLVILKLFVYLIMTYSQINKYYYKK